jgi:hypothetical protein
MLSTQKAPAGVDGWRLGNRHADLERPAADAPTFDRRASHRQSHATAKLELSPLEILAGALAESCGPGRDISAVMADIPDARPPGRGAPGARPVSAATPVRRFRPRRYQCSPDRRASRDRRRTWAGAGLLPPNARGSYTPGETAVLTVIALEVKRRGFCDLPNDRIAATAGVCRTTVKNALRRAKDVADITVTERPVPGRKSLTNVVRIVSRKWLTWIQRGRAAGIGGKTVSPSKILPPTKNRYSHTRAPEPVERQHGIRLECG